MHLAWTKSFEVRRIVDLLSTLLAVAVGVACANLLMLLVFGPSPRVLREGALFYPGEFERMGAQIAAAERSLEADSLSGMAHRPLAIVAGLSTAVEDIDADVLDERMCTGARVLNLGSSGGSFRELAYYLEPVEHARLHASLFILAVHPVWINSREIPAPPRLKRESGVGDAMGELLWARTNQNSIRTAITNSFLRTRAMLINPFGLSAAALFPVSSVDPWQPRYQYHTPRATQTFLNDQLQFWSQIGWFAPKVYSPTGGESEALQTVVREAVRLADQTVIILLPESSLLREHVPAEAERRFRQAVAELHLPIPVVDLRSSMPDSLFYDYAHLNAAGRSRFSRILGPEVGVLTSCRQHA